MPDSREPKDVDAESRRLLTEMNQLIERGRLLLHDRQRALASDVLPHASSGTLGSVLYAKPPQVLAPEKDWVSLVRSIAARDELALHALYERVREPVCTLIMRIVRSRDVAERLTGDVLLDVWQEAGHYEAAAGTVLAWVMNLARARAIAGPRSVDAASPRVTLPPQPQWIEPPWEEVAPGITVKMLAVDPEKHMVGMLVRLAPGGEYPAHTHAALEELHLLEGELWIDDRKLYPGDYNRAEPGSGDQRVWSETGCACVLITSTRDLLR